MNRVTRGRYGRARWAAVTAAALAPAAACFSPSPITGLGCADTEPRCPGGQVCDDAAGVCVPDSALATWRDDTVADFAQPTAVLADATVELDGAIGAAPYFADGLAVWGIASAAIDDGAAATVSWDAIAALPTTGHGFTRSLDLYSDTDEPLTGSYLANTDATTIRIEGELLLDAGATLLSLDADDRGFVELQDPSSGTWNRLAADVDSDTQEREYTVAEDTWVRFRAAYTNVDDDSELELRMRPPGSGFQGVSRYRMRARVDGVAGLALDGFDGPYLWTPLGVSIADYPVASLAYTGNDAPPGQPHLGGGGWTQRFAGQVLVTVPGAYAFELDSEGGHRMWIDGERVADSGGAGIPGSSRTDPIELAAGWHDVVVDWMKSSGFADPTFMTLVVADGPELVDGFFPPERTRPVVGRGARWTYSSSNGAQAIAEGASTTKTVYTPVPSGVGEVELADYTYLVSHAALATLQIQLAIDGGAPFTLVAAGDLEGMGNYSQNLHEGASPVGGWALTVTDTAAADTFTGTLSSAQIATTYAGGLAPLATHAVYTSAIRDLGAVVAISGVRWQTRQDPGGAVIVRVRSGVTPETCMAAAWVTVAASGDVAGIEALPFVQYQVELAGDGDRAPALEWIEIDYRN